MFEPVPDISSPTNSRKKLLDSIWSALVFFFFFSVCFFVFLSGRGGAILEGGHGSSLWVGRDRALSR